MVAVHKIKEVLMFNKTAYVVFVLIFDCHYNYIKCKYGKKARPLFTDTDSLTYEIKANDM